MKLPEEVVEAQLAAYNKKDLDAVLRTFHPEAEQYALHGALLAKGHEQMRARYLMRFQEPDLHAQLLRRTVIGNVVIDHERVTRNFAQGIGHVEMMCLFEVVDGLIVKSTYLAGPEIMGAR